MKKRILEVMQRGLKYSPVEISQIMGISNTYAWSLLKSLQRSRLVKAFDRTGTRGRPAKEYALK